MKKSNKTEPDRVVLFESGLVLTLLLVNWVLHLSYVPTVIPDYPADRHPAPDSAFQLPKSWDKPVRKLEPVSELKIDKPFHPAARIKTVDDNIQFVPEGLKLKDLLKPKGPLKLKLPAWNPGPDAVDSFPDVLAQFPGGEEALSSFIDNNLRIPYAVKEYGKDINVVVRFIVYTDGTVGEVNVIYCSKPGLGAEAAAIRAVQTMPRWTPGEKNGQKRSTCFNLPIHIEF